MQAFEKKNKTKKNRKTKRNVYKYLNHYAVESQLFEQLGPSRHGTRSFSVLVPIYMLFNNLL